MRFGDSKSYRPLSNETTKIVEMLIQRELKRIERANRLFLLQFMIVFTSWNIPAGLRTKAVSDPREKSGK